MSAADFLLELRCEEIPARMQARARNDLARMFAGALGDAGLAHRASLSRARQLHLVAALLGAAARNRLAVAITHLVQARDRYRELGRKRGIALAQQMVGGKRAAAPAPRPKTAAAKPPAPADAPTAEYLTAEQKLAELKGDELKNLMDKGILARVYAHILSQLNFQRLLDRRAAKLSTPGGATTVQ